MKNCFLIVLLAYSANLFSQNYNVTYRDTIMFPGQALSNIWGFKKGGHEYALVGASKGLVIVDVTDPNNCFRVGTQLTDYINSFWREVRTFENYAFITSEGLTPSGTPNPPGVSKGGLGIVDLSGLPANPPTTVTKYYAAGASDPEIDGNLNRVHSLHVDSIRSMLYLYGSSGVSCNGALRFDISTPNAPVYVDKYCSNYVHDGYVHKDTLFGALINAGKMSIIKFETNPFTGLDTVPYLIDDITTPNAFTHNTWLSVNRQFAFTTDEKQNSFLTAYDVSDRTNIIEKDKIRTGTPNSIIHNTYVKGNHAISSWYEDGISIVDVSRPTNLIQTGRYDTYPTPPFPVGGSHFYGAWGVYPYLPSGNLLVTNMFENKNESNPDTGVLYILTPTYVSACYLEGNVKDSITNANLIGVAVAIQHTDPLNSTTSGLTGDYATGQPTAGTFNVTYSKTGYITRIIPATLVNGVVTTKNVKLLAGSFSDIGVSAMLSPQSDCELGSTETVSVVLQNFGTDPISGFNIAYKLDGGTPAVQSSGALSIPALGTANFTFTTPANLSALGVHTIQAYTIFPDDDNALNDTIAVSVINGQIPNLEIIGSAATVCAGTEVSLSVVPIPGAKYNWSTGEQTNEILVSPNSTTTYSVTVTIIANGCSGTDDFTVQTIPGISVSITPSGTVAFCQGSAVTLNATATPGIGSGTWLWNTGATEPAINVAASGTYAVTATAVNGCTGSASVIAQTYPVNLTLNGMVIASGEYRTSGDLTALNSIVLNGSTVTLISDTGVLLQQDFTVELGAVFEAMIEACQ